MATFESQIEGLTGLTIEATNTVPLQDNVTQFLRDGVTEVINRIISTRPEEISKFTTTTNSTGTVTKKGRILSVVREHDSTSILRACRVIAPELRYEATDTESFHYRSKFNPAYYELDGQIACIPAAGGGNNDIIVTQVNYDTGIAYGDTEDSIANFPQEYGYLVTLYAACKCLFAAMANLASELPKDIVIPPVPEKPTISDVSMTITGTAPEYTKTAVAPDFADAENWLNVEEDSEMVQSRLQIIQSQLAEYQANIQNELNEFNKETVEYQAKLQKDAKDADYDDSKNGMQIQLYEREISAYQAKIATEVQDYTNKINKIRSDYEWMESRCMLLKGQYDQAFGSPAPNNQQNPRGGQ